MSYLRREFLKLGSLSALSMAPFSTALAGPDRKSMTAVDELRTNLIISQSGNLPTQDNIRQLQEQGLLKKDENHFLPKSRLEYELRSIHALARLSYGMEEMLATPKGQVAVLAKVSEALYGEIYPPVDSKLQVNLQQILTWKDSEANQRFNEKKDSVGTAIDLIGLALPKSRLSSIGRTLISSLPDKTTLFGSETNTEQAAMEVANALREHVIGKLKSNSNLAKAVKKDRFLQAAFNIPADKTLKDLVDSAPETVRQALTKVSDNPEKGLTLEEKQLLADELISAVNAQYGKFRESLTLEYLKNKDKAEAEARKAQADRQFVESEIRSSAYVIGLIGNALFNDPSFSSKVNAVYSSYSQISNLMSGLANGTAGVMTGIGTFASVASLMGGMMNGFRDPVMETLGEIQKSIGTLRKEMHERFDRIVTTQQVIIEQLDEVLKGLWNLREETSHKLSEIQKALHRLDDKINGQDDYLRTQDRKEAEVFFSSHIKKLQVEFADKTKNKTYHRTAVREAVAAFISYAQDVSEYPAYTMNEIPSTWDAGKVLGSLKKMEMLDLSCGTLPAIYNKITGNALPDIPNPIVYSRGVWAYNCAANEFPAALNEAHRSFEKELQKEGADIQTNLEAVVDDAVIKKLKEEYERLFHEVAHAVTFGTKESLLPTPVTPPVIPLPKIYPFESTQWPAEGKLTGRNGVDPSPYPMPIDGLWAQNAFLSIRNMANVACIFDTSYGNFSHLDGKNYNVTYYYPNLDIISLTQQYKVTANSSIGKSGTADVTLEAFNLRFEYGRLKGITNLLIEERYFHGGFPQKYRVSTINNPSNPLATPFPVNVGSLSIKSVEELCQVLLEELRAKHKEMQNEFKAKMFLTLQSPSGAAEQVTKEFEAVGASLAYLAGIKSWLNGEKLGPATIIAQSADAIFGSREQLAAQIQDILKEVPKDTNGNPVYPDKSIDDYVYQELKARFQVRLDKFMNAQFPESAPDKNLAELNLARGTLDGLILNQNTSTHVSRLPDSEKVRKR